MDEKKKALNNILDNMHRLRSIRRDLMALIGQVDRMGAALAELQAEFQDDPSPVMIGLDMGHGPDRSVTVLAVKTPDGKRTYTIDQRLIDEIRAAVERNNNVV